MKRDRQDRSSEALRTFCDDAARQMLGIETRLRTLIAAATEPRPDLLLLEEALQPSLQIAKAMLDAGRHAGTASCSPCAPSCARSRPTVREPARGYCRVIG
jgi:hypothetical protein